ncbi:hypothetical protein BDR06DRAFT_1071144 [Suillus hirtellus]|nr:hypothetical protein BDR06DRAFT_1071144 [Suillus hirtellus]
MSKRAGSSGGEPTPKCHKGNQAIPSALYDNGAWTILQQFLTTSMSLSEMDDTLVAYLGDRYSADDWVEPRCLLFSGDADNDESLRNLSVLWKTYIPDPLEKSSMRMSASRKHARLPSSHARKSHKPSDAVRMFISHEAEAGDEEEEEEEEGYGDGTSVQSPKVTCLPGLSAKQRLAVTFDEMATRIEKNPASSSKSLQAPSHRAIKSRMYLLHVQRAVTEYITEHLQRKQFPITVSAWLAGQLYVVADSPKSIADTLPSSLYHAVKQYLRITEEEREAVKRSQVVLPNPAWVKIKHGKHKGFIGRIFKSGKDFVEVLCPPCDFPYPMPRGCRALVERSRLLKNNLVSDIILNDEVVGWTYKGESYYKGLLLKKFCCDHLELLASPHADAIQLHLESGWDTAFLKKTIIEFSMQFLCMGDWARVTNGALHGELSRVILTDHACGSVGLEIAFDGHPDEIELHLQDIERVFRVGDTIRVIAGSYLGLEGYVLKMCGETFHVEVSKHYLDQLLDGEHIGKHGIVDWISKGESKLWFRDIITPDDMESGLSSILVPTSLVQRTDLAQTIQYTRERGYDVRPGDTVTVARGPEYGATGVMQSVDFPNANLTLLCNGDRLLINVKIGFTIKLHNTSLDSFKKNIGQEAFVIGGDRKGYRATLYGLAPQTCTVAVHGQQHTNVKLRDVVTRYGMRLNGVVLEGSEMIAFCNMWKRSFLVPPARSITPPVEMAPSNSLTSITDDSPSSSNTWAPWSTSPGEVDRLHDPSSSTINPISLTPDPWTVDKQQSIDTDAEKLSDCSPLSWLMTKEFFLKLFKYHMVLKVSPSFMGGRLSKQFVFTASPDPFCGENGPAPSGCIAAFCTSNGAGAAIKHYHIPASDLSPASPHKKNQHVLILNGEHCGLIQTIASCYNKDGVVKIMITPTVTITLRTIETYIVISQEEITRGTLPLIRFRRPTFQVVLVIVTGVSMEVH